MKARLLIAGILVAALLATACGGGKPAPTTLTVPSVAAGQVANPKLALASCYEMEGFTIDMSAPSYTLPLSLGGIVNLAGVESKLGLGDGEEELLKSNGFVVVPYGQVDDIVEPYEMLKERESPIFVTSDTLLHLYHIQFNEVLKRIEEEEFFNAVLDMSKA
ncbi:MAG: DUF3160 domain-containing protein, partial [Chloroflexota bacterium]|nr:DUF3160 domain-containing protein [Chloroflexota bacterium]